jgi:hypothetical protein
MLGFTVFLLLPIFAEPELRRFQQRNSLSRLVSPETGENKNHPAAFFIEARPLKTCDDRQNDHAKLLFIAKPSC